MPPQPLPLRRLAQHAVEATKLCVMANGSMWFGTSNGTRLWYKAAPATAAGEFWAGVCWQGMAVWGGVARAHAWLSTKPAQQCPQQPKQAVCAAAAGCEACAHSIDMHVLQRVMYSCAQHASAGASCSCLIIQLVLI